jgi:hypothetical protein
MYKKRINSKSKLENTMYKLLMNSLYGRFAMEPNFNNTKVIIKEDFEYYNLLFNIKNKYKNATIINYSFSDEMIASNLRFLKKNCIFELADIIKIDKIANEHKSKSSNTNIAIQISSAISSYARIKLLKSMYKQIKNGGQIYYYDTDSIFTDKKLPKIMTHPLELGKFKLEYKIKEGIFLSPKNYGIIKEDFSEIIKFKGLINKFKTTTVTFDFYKQLYTKKETLKT